LERVYFILGAKSLMSQVIASGVTSRHVMSEAMTYDGCPDTAD